MIAVETIAIETRQDRMVLGPSAPPADLLLVRHLGLDGMDAIRWEQTSPLTIGSRDIGRKITPRTATIEVGLAADTPADTDRLRRRLQALLAPHDDLFNIAVTGLDGTVRHARASCLRPPALDSGRRLQALQRSRFQIRCPDPRFYGGQPHAYTILGAPIASGSGYTIPLPIPFGITGQEWGGNITINYMGAWPAVPAMRVTGPISRLQIANDRGGGAQFTSTYDLPAGTSWHFDPAGTRTFELETGGVRTSGAHTVDPNSKIDGWVLHPGSNTIMVASSGQQATTSVVITWTDVYTGI